MRELFATILDNAWVVSIMILVIVLIRTFMKKMPKFIYPLLWGLVAVKLLLPYDIHSSFGMLPSDKTIESVSYTHLDVYKRQVIPFLRKCSFTSFSHSKCPVSFIFSRSSRGPSFVSNRMAPLARY